MDEYPYTFKIQFDNSQTHAGATALTGKTMAISCWLLEHVGQENYRTRWLSFSITTTHTDIFVIEFAQIEHHTLFQLTWG